MGLGVPWDNAYIEPKKGQFSVMFINMEIQRKEQSSMMFINQFQTIHQILSNLRNSLNPIDVLIATDEIT